MMGEQFLSKFSRSETKFENRRRMSEVTTRDKLIYCRTFIEKLQILF
jgi:hypothetical protein